MHAYREVLFSAHVLKSPKLPHGLMVSSPFRRPCTLLKMQSQTNLCEIRTGEVFFWVQVQASDLSAAHAMIVETCSLDNVVVHFEAIFLSGIR